MDSRKDPLIVRADQRNVKYALLGIGQCVEITEDGTCRVYLGAEAPYGLTIKRVEVVTSPPS